MAGPRTEKQTWAAAKKKAEEEQGANEKAAVNADFRKIYGDTKESVMERRRADDDLRKKSIPLAPCINEQVPPPPRMMSLEDPFRQVPPQPPPTT